MIRQLYHAALKQDADSGGVSSKTTADINALLQELKSESDGQEYMIHTDDILLAASAAEENGFVKGFLYAFQLLKECSEK